MNSESKLTADDNWITLARLIKVRGNRGELAAVDLTSRADRLESLRRVWLFGDGSPRNVSAVWRHDGVPIFKFEGVDTISDAELLVGADVCVPREERSPLGEGEFYQSDLVGCDVFETGGGRLGTVREFLEYGGTPLLELEDGLLIPFARAICTEIDPAARRIVVELPAGLKDVNRP